MAGAMAGSAILAARSRKDSLSIVTLTINNTCNLACPHCYLQYAGPEFSALDWVFDAVLDSNCEGISIVGKEPLANKASADSVRELVERAAEKGKWVSLITNGLNAALLPLDVAAKLAWIDVSLDGGATSYDQYRGGSWEKLSRSLRRLRSDAGVDLRLMQTLSAATVPAIDEMLAVAEELGATTTIFSPFQPTRSSGIQSAVAIGPEAYLSALEPYRSAVQSFYVTMDALYLNQFSVGDVARRGVELFGDRFIYVGTDPIDRGLIRVTYDGLVMTPFASVDTADYSRIGIRLATGGLDSIFSQLHGISSQHSLH
jgi:MoaA/NifB/PqqE/SkfB family radical SAM enzyme